ncbi:MAG: hypothetical protein DMG06_16090 [Acidobacteria bacterium]|nr:MAG: hypothetical protein DMG06_16090 [Acidobacteriota bacterium]
MVDIWKSKRSEARIALAMPVTIEGDDISNNHFREETTTENVSKSGACLAVTRELRLGTAITVTACQGKFKGQAVVKGIWIDDYDRKTKIGIQFSGPIQNWVVN